VVELVRLLKEESGRRVLDLGCGLGRHLLLLAAEGLEAHGIDVSPTAVETCRRRLREAGFTATVTHSDMSAIPQPDSFFDAVIAWNVVYHATTEEMVRAISSVRDKLKERGWFLVTFISTAGGQYGRTRKLLAEGRATELEPGTFVVPGDTVTDKALPHHYSTEREIREKFLDGFEVVRLEESRAEASDFEGHRYASDHWQALARKHD
jgi:cyclopropane fatty-acyl-phospholipid synthase-like methyltransferase